MMQEQLWRARFEFQKLSNVYTSITIQFLGPKETASVIELVNRWWMNRHAAFPDLYHRLLQVSFVMVTPQRIDTSGFLPPDTATHAIKWRPSMKNEGVFRTALRAAYKVGEETRVANNRQEWTEEELEAAAQELHRRLFDDADA